jgi:hypothetical protein
LQYIFFFSSAALHLMNKILGVLLPPEDKSLASLFTRLSLYFVASQDRKAKLDSIGFNYKE